MSNIGFAGVADFAMTSAAAAVRIMGVTGVGSNSEVVQGPSLALNFLPMTGSTTVLDPRITFSRTSNATLTGSNGRVQYAPHNLLTYSEQFDNAAWFKSGTTITPNTTVAPDGTLTADAVFETNTNDFHVLEWRGNQSTSQVSDNYTFSVAVKANGRASVRISAYQNLSPYPDINATFNLLDGSYTTGNSGSGVFVSASSTNLGNGWYRCTITGRTGQATINNFQLTYNSNSYQGDPTKGLYIWGAQLEIGSTATTYNPTTVKNLLGYTEHFDNAAWTKSNAFVQTNLLTYSQEFDNAAWSKGAATVAANSMAAPDGSITADTVAEDTTTAGHSVYRNAGSLTGAYTQSLYVKPNGRTWVYLEPAGTSASRTWFSLSGDGALGTVGTGVTAAISSVGNGWYRLVATFTYAAQNCFVTCGVTTGNGVTSYTGDGTSGIFIWGAQLVQGSVAGDYQVTTAAAAAVQYAGPFGYLSAEKLVATAVSGNHRAITQAQATVSGTRYTASVYVKQGEYTKVGIGEFNNAAGWASFDLSTGTVLSSGGSGSAVASITAVGDGWFRCAFSFLAGAFSRFDIYALNNAYTTGDPPSYTYTGDGTSGIYIFGAQLSDSASLDPYVYNPVAAPAAAAYYGPRFDYDPVTLAPKGLLIEEQRTNLLTYSEDFTNAAWTKIGITLTSNSTVAPDGTATAETLVEDGSTGNHWLYQSGGGAAAYSATVYAKAAGRSWLVFRFTVSGTITYAWFNVSTGALGTVEAGLTAAITPAGNGWYRCSISGTMSASSAIVIGAANANGSSIYTGNSGNALYLWGAQLEAGSFATSYIPTVASQVTRAADSASMIGNNFARWYNQNAGTMYAEFDYTGAGSTVSPGVRTAFNISDGTSSNRLQIYNISGNVGSFIATGGAAQAALDNFVPSAVNVVQKVSLAFSSNDATQALNAVLGPQDTSVILPAVNAAYIGGESGSNRVGGHIRRIAYFPRRLSNSELQSITA